MGGEGCPLKRDSYCTVSARGQLSFNSAASHRASPQGLLQLCICYKEGKSTTQVPLPDYSGALLGIRGDDLEKQFHGSINSQHGSRGDCERTNHSSY